MRYAKGCNFNENSSERYIILLVTLRMALVSCECETDIYSRTTSKWGKCGYFPPKKRPPKDQINRLLRGKKDFKPLIEIHSQLDVVPATINGLRINFGCALSLRPHYKQNYENFAPFQELFGSQTLAGILPNLGISLARK